MYAIDALPRQTLRPHERIDSLRCAPALRWATPAASAARYEHRSSAESTAGTSWAPEAARRRLSGDRIPYVSKCALRVRTAGPTITGLRETAHLVRGLTHRDGPDHLNRIGRSRWPQLSWGCIGILLVVRIGLVDLILASAIGI
jgi:hypothetical protein